MKYIEAFESTDRIDFYRAVEYLEANNIEFQKLHEYRLHAESNFGAEGEPAILRVKAKDASTVNKLLVEGGFIKNGLQQKSQNGLKDKSFLDRELYQSEIQKISGKKIEKVTYVLANEVDYDLDSIHSVDFAIGIQLENGNFLWWTFEEEDVDFENDFFLPNRYELKFHNILKEIDKEFKIEDVSGNDYWNQFLGKPIKDIKIYSQEFRTNKIVTDLVIETDSKRVAIFSAGEPTEEEEQIEVHLSIDNGWTIVVFDEETMKESERIEN